MIQMTLTDWTGSLDITDGIVYFAPLDVLKWTDADVSFPMLITAGDADTRIDAASAIQGYFTRAANAIALGRLSTFDLTFGGSRIGSWDMTGGDVDLVRPRSGGAAGEYTITVTFTTNIARSSALPVFTGDVTGATAGFAAHGLSGDASHLVHLDFADTSVDPITRIHWCSTPAGMWLDDATDYTPWVNASPSGDGGTVVDGNAYGGSHAAATVEDTDWHEIARISQPAGSWQQGTFDGFVRAAGVGTAIAKPSSLSAAVQAAAFSTTGTAITAKDGAASGGITGSGTVTGGASTTISRAGATSGAALLLVAVTALNGNSATLTPTATGATFTTELLRSDGTTQVQGWIAANASGTSTITVTQVVGVGAGVPATKLYLMELIGIESAPNITDLAYTIAATEPNLSVTTSDTGDQVVALLGGPDTGVVTAISGGMTGLGNGAWKQVSGSNQSVSAKVILTTGTWTGFMVALTVPTHVVSQSQTTYTEPTPGNLAAGDYTARVQAKDMAGYRGNATNSSTATAANRDAILWSCPAVTNATEYVWTIQYGTDFYEAITSTPSFTLTSLDGLGNVDALPATVGAVAPPPVMRLRIGTSGDTVMQPLGEIALTGVGAFQLFRAFGRRLLPPIAPMLDSWQPWEIAVEVRSANGNSATGRVDATWLAPAGTYAMAEVKDGTLGAPATWHVETHRSGRDTVAWTDDGATLRTFGVPLLSPPDAAGYLAFESANGHSFALGGSLSVSTITRMRQEGGS